MKNKQQYEGSQANSREHDFWDDLTDQQKAAIETGLKQSKSGKTQDFYRVFKECNQPIQDNRQDPKKHP